MRQDRDGRVRLSPSDLNDFLACPHLPALELLRAAGKADPAKGPRPDADLIRERGLAHERAFLERLRADGLDVLALPDDGPATGERARLTEEAMHSGADAIYQAAFDHDGWHGFADFLIRIEEPSALGEWSYEAHDAKLASHPKPYFILQLVFYSEQVGRIQERLPERMHLILGTEERPSFRTSDFTAYAARVRERYLAYLDEVQNDTEPPYPYPVEHCAWCDWWARCRDKRRADDHLSLVAFLSRGQAVKLEDSGCHTVVDLAELSAGVRVERLANRTLAGLRQQARLQVQARRSGENVRELLQPEHGRGLARLPDPSAGDVFFDIEGDPYWGDGGLEYLFGSLTDDGTYRPLWAHDREEERRMFEQWIEWITHRLTTFPDMHIYHYNAYEPTAVKKLMSRYGTRERDVDELLGRQVFVDLYAVVRQSMRIGKESYSLKSVEDFYGFTRDADVTEAGGSMLAYREWLESRSDTQLQAIADYNADDCRSTLGLRDWLLREREEAEREFGVEIAALEPEPEKPVSEEKQALLDELAELTDRLTAGLPEEEDADLDVDQRAHRLLADLLEYHHREQRPQWWAYFERLVKTPEELQREDTEAIGGLSLADSIPLREEDRSYLYPLRLEAQEHKIGTGAAVDPATEAEVTVRRVDDAEGVLWLKRGQRSHEKPLPKALIPGQPIQQREQQTRLRDLAVRVCQSGLEPIGTLDPACDLLTQRSPRIRGVASGDRLHDGGMVTERLVDLVADLEQSALFIQGPPGSGKTWTASRVIVGLIQRGLRVGVAATSHKAIHKLLDDIEEAADEGEVSFRGLKKASAQNPDSAYHSERIESTNSNSAFPGDPSEHQLLAGTGWLWSRKEMREAVDVLFVDEAGQVSLADALAVSQGARNVVLLGDPQQLAHVSQGVHPRGSGSSVLRHLLGDAETVAPDRGVFLDRTFRMHPDVCRFVSDAMYDGRLSSVSGLEGQRVESVGISGAGLRVAFVDHFDNRQRAPEEADRIADEVAALLAGGRFTEPDGTERCLTLDDVLVVAPYNMQVRCLRDRLPPGTRVGTVDKFQGQQAPIVFFSMTSSTGEDVPRGMDFLFSRNRLNVAVSRARAIAVVVCSQPLLSTRCSSVEQMRLVNALCRFADSAKAI
jgi:predicted RecB family nuclease